MVVAASLGDFLWSLFVIFFMVCYFMILFRVIIDIFRRQEASGWNKAAWLLFVFALPMVGLLTYLIVHSNDMAERDVNEAYAMQQQVDTHIRNVAGGSAAEIAQAKALLDQGAITQTEYERLKERALAV